MKKLVFVLVLLVVGLIVWVKDLRQQLQSARMRGDTYRDISMRLDRKLVEQQSSDAGS
jgi:hypothetical protein